MKCVVFVPGILGSELVDPANNTIWPPKLSEIVFGYGRIHQLMSPDLRPAAVIRSVSVYPVYKSILDDIDRCGYSIGGSSRRFLPFPYDWRRSNATSAQLLSNELTALDQQEALDELVLIGHSMGGLVVRYLLESGAFEGESWFAKVSTLITLGTPHFGAPQALARLLGNEPQLGLSGPNLVMLASDPEFPSLYQLVSAPESALTVPRVPPGQVPDKLDSFDPAIQSVLTLEPRNVQSARDFWARLDIAGGRPAHVKYYLVGCAAHKTTARNEWDDPTLNPIDRRQSGDGTVPIVSSIISSLPHGYSMKKHARIFEDRDFRRSLYRFLDAPSGVKPQAADAVAEVGSEEAFGLSVDKDTYAVGEPIEIVASYNETVTDPQESFQIVGLDAQTGEELSDEATVHVEVEFRGVMMSSFSFVIAPDLAAGLWELRADREVDDPEPTLFVVGEPHA